MSDADQIKAGASALLAWPSLAIVLYICRSWCRGVARSLPVNSVFSRRALTWRLVRAMSWRAGLFLLVGIPVLLALGDALVAGLSFAMFSYPLAILSIWQHGRRISRHAFDAAATEAATPETTGHQQLVGIAQTLDGGSTTSQPTSDVRYISQTAYDAGLQTKRHRPTIVEGVALAAAALMIGSTALTIALPLFAHRRTTLRNQPSPPNIPEEPTTLSATSPTTTPKTVRQLTPATSIPSAPAHFSTRTEATTAVWNKFYPEAHASQQQRIAMQNLEDAIVRFGSASAAVQTDAILDPSIVTQDPKKQLQTLKASATDTLSAIHEYKEQTRLGLLRTRLTPNQQQQVITITLKGYRLFEAWAAAALQAADAGLTLRDLYSRNLPSETAKQHFIDAWNACCESQQAVFSHAQATQQTAEDILRK